MKKNVGTLKMWLVALGFALASAGLSSYMGLSSSYKGQSSFYKGQSTSASAKDNVQGLELPVTKSKLSQTIKRRTAYTVSYNHNNREPNWVAWVLTRDHASGKLPRGDFRDDMDMPSPKGTKADYYNSGFDRGHM